MSTRRPKGSNSIDMLNGPLPGKIVLFAIPLALSSILQQLFNSADAIFAGRMISSEALAAVGGVAPIISLFVTLMVGLSIGANVVVAVHIGHGERHKVRGAIQTTVIVTLVCSVLFTAAGIALTDPVLTAVNIPAEAWDEAAQYLHVYFAGFAFFLIYNFGSAVLRAKGDSRRPLYALALAAALNIVLNWVAVAIFNAGVAGIALATVASNAVSAGVIVWFMLHEEEDFRLTFRGGVHVNGADLRQLLYIGLPAGFQGAVFALSNVVIQGAVNSFGTDAVGGATAAMNYEYYTYFFVNAFSQAAVTFTGQNYAAGQLKRCDTILRFCMGAAIGSALFVSVIVVALGNVSLGIFTTQATALAFGTVRLWTVELFEFMTSTYEITAGAMRGMGWSVLPTVITIVGSCLLRIIYVLTIFPSIDTFDNLMMLYPVTWVITGTSMIILYVFARRRSYAKRTDNGRITTAA